MFATATARPLKLGLLLIQQTRVGLPLYSLELPFTSQKLAKAFTVSRNVSDQTDQGTDSQAIEFNDVNKVFLSGRVFREPRAFQSQYSDRVTTRITLVSADVYQKRDTDEQRVSRSYFDVATDQTLSPEIRAGAHVMIEGRLRKYKKTDGSYSVEVRAVGPISVLKESSEPLEEKTVV
ncbi:hypothetical protein BJ742DRAFT_766353 [Cladochytrium replicatum]|nr:hypothetical protein BJ742DRAFT_766353 [Cladochytrium replicatum]